MEKLHRKLLSSEKIGKEILGAFVKEWWLVLLLAVSLGLIFVPGVSEIPYAKEILAFVALCAFVLAIMGACNTLTTLFSLRKEDVRLTCCQIWILVSIGIWIIGTILIFNIQKSGRSTLAVTVLGSILFIVFQDKIKGAATFIHLRVNHLLSLGDWIEIPRLGADGVVSKITLTTVTIFNWDTTTSVIPISALQEGLFVNLQNMSDGKTYGRQLVQNFSFDTDYMRPITEEEARRLRENPAISDLLPENEIKEGAINSQLFRQYIYNWLRANPHIALQPFMLVRWTGQTESGMTMEIYTYLANSGLESYAWRQSEIVEHVVESLDWFGLKLFQRGSSHDKNTKEDKA